MSTNSHGYNELISMKLAKINVKSVTFFFFRLCPVHTTKKDSAKLIMNLCPEQLIL